MNQESNSEIESSASNLKIVNGLVLAIALVGSFILIGFGIYGDCVDNCNCGAFCIDSRGMIREPNTVFIIVGFVGVLVSLLAYQVIRLFALSAGRKS